MKIFFTCIFCVLFSNLSAQQKPLSFEHLTLENGLPENYPRCIIQDKMGYIWIGTQNGLVRFDGYSSKVYKLVTGKPGGSGKEQITCLFADKQGLIWVGMRYDGLFRYNRSEDNFSQVKAGSPSDNITTHGEVRFITEDKNDKLWVVNYDYKTDKCRLVHYDPTDSSLVDYCRNNKAAGQFPADQIYCLLTDKAGRIWFGTNDGLYEFDENTKTFPGYLTNNDPSA